MLRRDEKEESLIEFVAEKMALWIRQRREMKETEYLKMKLGIETILINVTKGIIVYGLAIILNIFFSTLVLHSAYFVVRRVSFGLHAKSSINCTIASIVMFVIIPYFLKDIIINDYVMQFLFLVCLNCLYCFAPADTEKHPLIGEEKREKLRNQSVATCIVLMVVALVVPIPMVKTLITAGLTLQVINILPITYKILKRSYNNYEKYEG